LSGPTKGFGPVRRSLLFGGLGCGLHSSGSRGMRLGCTGSWSPRSPLVAQRLPPTARCSSMSPLLLARSSRARLTRTAKGAVKSRRNTRRSRTKRRVTRLMTMPRASPRTASSATMPSRETQPSRITRMAPRSSRAREMSARVDRCSVGRSQVDRGRATSLPREPRREASPLIRWLSPRRFGVGPRLVRPLRGGWARGGPRGGRLTQTRRLPAVGTCFIRSPHPVSRSYSHSSFRVSSRLIDGNG